MHIWCFLKVSSSRPSHWNPRLTRLLDIVFLFLLSVTQLVHTSSRAFGWLFGNSSQCTLSQELYCAIRSRWLTVFHTRALACCFQSDQLCDVMLAPGFPVGSSRSQIFNFHIPTWLLPLHFAFLTSLLVLPEAILSVNCSNIIPTSALFSGALT